MGAHGQRQGDLGVMSGPMLKDEGQRQFTRGMGWGEGNIPETGKVMHKAQRSKKQGMFGKFERVR